VLCDSHQQQPNTADLGKSAGSLGHVGECSIASTDYYEEGMSTIAHSLVTWADFLLLPERPETGKRYELHDGKVVLVPPARPIHIKLQKRIEQLLEALAGDRGVVTLEFPYRPFPNLQYWFADVAYVPRAEWDAMPSDEYPIYAPPFGSPVTIQYPRQSEPATGRRDACRDYGVLGSRSGKENSSSNPFARRQGIRECCCRFRSGVRSLKLRLQVGCESA
jgi:Putative restriction endonuclease